MRDNWQHTSFIVGHIIATNVTKKSDIPSMESLNPMESAGQSKGIPLNSPMAGEAMKAIAASWRQKH